MARNVAWLSWLALGFIAQQLDGDDDSVSVVRAWPEVSQELAFGGTDRRTILDLWKLYLRLKPGDVRAKEIVVSYESLAAEDKLFVRKSAAELRKMPPSEQAAYWTYLLRDITIWVRRDQFGLVTGEGGHLSEPMRNLEILGWDAIPELIEHVEDGRPTRSIKSSQSKFTGRTSARHFTYAEFANQLLEDITGRQFQTTTAARKWWQRVKRRGAESFYRTAVRHERAANKHHAAGWLVRKDLPRFLPIVAREVRFRGALPIATLAMWLERDIQRDHRGSLEGFLRHDHPRVVALASLLLKSVFDSDQGALALAELVRRYAEVDPGVLVEHGKPAISALADLDSDQAHRRLFGLLKLDSPWVLAAAIRAVPRTRESLRAALELLGDRRLVPGPSEDPGLRVCDAAAWEMSIILNDELFRLDRPVRVRNEHIERLRKDAEMKKNAVDWSRFEQPQGAR